MNKRMIVNLLFLLGFFAGSFAVVYSISPTPGYFVNLNGNLYNLTSPQYSNIINCTNTKLPGENVCSKFSNLYFNSPNSENYSLQWNTNSNFKFNNSKKYSSTCTPSISSFLNGQLKINSGLSQPILIVSNSGSNYNGNYSVQNIPPILLNNSYFLKTLVEAVLQTNLSGNWQNFTDGNSNNIIFYPANSIDSSPYSSNGNIYGNYFLLKPGQNNLNFNLPLNNSDFKKDHPIVYNQIVSNPGTYRWKIIAKPIDLKCDFNKDGSLNYTTGPGQEATINTTTTSTFQIFPDADNDGWDDVGNLGKGHDLCPNQGNTSSTGSFSLTTLNKYRGCGYEYTNLSCNGEASYNIKTNTLYNNGGHSYCGDLVGFGNNVDSLYGASSMTPSQGSGIYSVGASDNGLGCSWWDGYPSITGSCNLRFNAPTNCTLTKSGEVMGSGDNWSAYKYLRILPYEKNNYLQISCYNGVVYNNTGDRRTNKLNSTTLQYAFHNPIRLGSDYDNVIRDANGNFEVNDSSPVGKISCPENNLSCSLNLNGKDVNVNLSKVNNTNTGYIRTYSNGALVSVIHPDPKIVALNEHVLANFNTKSSALDFVNKSIQLMNKFNIVKNLTYNTVTNKTTVQISTSNIGVGSQIQNFTIYQIIPKSIVNNYDNITFGSDGGGERFVMDKEPVIGWYFNETTGNNTINYTLSGNNQGGTIILSQTPILYNEGELVINYRQGKKGCFPGEVHLFDLNSLTASKIYAKNSSTYQVCIADLNSSIPLSTNSGINTVNISSFNWNGNISSNFSELSNKLQMSTSKTGIYWDMRIQKNNPTGNFSCIGSYQRVGKTSLFGDCGYNISNRLWIHLGADYLPPNTTISYPFLGHTAKVKLSAKDNIGGSGVNETYYCIENSSNSCSQNGDFSQYSNELYLSCGTDWGCTKIVKYFSQDNAGNNETIHTQNIVLIDKGSSCQADCTAKPSPNRYLGECRNLNGCTFASSPGETGADKGKAVANKCNFLTAGSWVKYNSTDEIQCPNGPFRPIQFTNSSLSIVDPNCKNVITYPYSTIYNGETVKMDIITCLN